MSLQERLLRDYTEAVRRGETLRRDVLRYLRAQIKQAEVDQGRPLTDEEGVAVIQRLLRQQRESLEQFRRGGRADLVQRVEAEMAILQEYLPAQMSEEEIEALARQVIQEVGARGPADKGRVMGRLMPQVRGRAEGAQVNRVVTRLLEGMDPTEG